MERRTEKESKMQCLRQSKYDGFISKNKNSNQLRHKPYSNDLKSEKQI